MDPMLLSMLMGGGGSGGGGVNPLSYAASGLQAAFGIYQWLKSGKRPEFEIPKAALENKAIAENAYAEGMPTESYQNQQEAIQRNQTAALYKVGSTKQAGSQVGNVVSASNLATGDLNAQDALARRQNRQQLINANSVLANYQRQQNQDKINQQVQLESAGLQNMSGGAINAANMALYGGKKSTAVDETRTGLGIQPKSIDAIQLLNTDYFNANNTNMSLLEDRNGWMLNPSRFFSQQNSSYKVPYK